MVEAVLRGEGVAGVIAGVEVHEASCQDAGLGGDGVPRAASAGADLPGAGMGCPVGAGAATGVVRALVGDTGGADGGGAVEGRGWNRRRPAEAPLRGGG